MALGIVDKGTATAFDDTTPINTCTKSAVAINNGQGVLVAIGAADEFGAVSTVTWNGQALTLLRAQANASNNRGEVWFKAQCAGATGDVVVTMTTSAQSANIVIGVAEIQGVGAAAFDKTASNSGLGTSPSSGATTTTAQASEVLFGIVVSSLAVPVGGSWGGSFTAFQAANTATGLNDIAISTGYRIVSATGTYTAQKSFATSGQWSAIIVTLMEGVTVALEVGNVTAAGDEVTPAPGPLSVAIEVASIASAGLEVVTNPGPISVALELAELGVTGYAVGTGQVAYYPSGIVDTLVQSAIITDPFTGAPLTIPDTAYRRSRLSSRRCDKPYLALASAVQAGFTGIGGDEFTMYLVVTLHAMPIQLGDEDEPHFLASVHEAASGGRELCAIGVTPSGRICAQNYEGPILLTPAGVIGADGQPHMLTFRLPWNGTRGLGLDGVFVAGDTPTSALLGLYSPTSKPVRFMLFNGLEGRTRCECSISHWEIIPEGGNPIRWPMDETSGLGRRCQEYLDITGTGATPQWHDRDGLTAVGTGLPTDSDYSGDFDLTAFWYDPSVYGYPLVWGQIPNTPVGECLNARIKTVYTRRNPGDSDYSKLVLP